MADKMDGFLVTKHTLKVRCEAKNRQIAANLGRRTEKRYAMSSIPKSLKCFGSAAQEVVE